MSEGVITIRGGHRVDSPRPMIYINESMHIAHIESVLIASPLGSSLGAASRTLRWGGQSSIAVCCSLVLKLGPRGGFVLAPVGHCHPLDFRCCAKRCADSHSRTGLASHLERSADRVWM